jgi:hypothetical protein
VTASTCERIDGWNYSVKGSPFRFIGKEVDRRMQDDLNVFSDVRPIEYQPAAHELSRTLEIQPSGPRYIAHILEKSVERLSIKRLRDRSWCNLVTSVVITQPVQLASDLPQKVSVCRPMLYARRVEYRVLAHRAQKKGRTGITRPLAESHEVP